MSSCLLHTVPMCHNSPTVSLDAVMPSAYDFDDDITWQRCLSQYIYIRIHGGFIFFPNASHLIPVKLDPIEER